MRDGHTCPYICQSEARMEKGKWSVPSWAERTCMTMAYVWYIGTSVGMTEWTKARWIVLWQQHTKILCIICGWLSLSTIILVVYSYYKDHVHVKCRAIIVHSWEFWQGRDWYFCDLSKSAQAHTHTRAPAGHRRTINLWCILNLS